MLASNQTDSRTSPLYLSVTVTHDSDTPIKFLFSSSFLSRAFIAIISFFAVCHAVTIYFAYNGMKETPIARGFNRLFNLNSEKGFANLFSGLILLTAAVLLYFIYRTVHKATSQKPKRQWLILSFVFLFLCFDETFSLHEKLIPITKQFLNTSANGFLLWGWVVPYFFLVVGVTAYFWRFVLKLPTSIRRLFFISGFIYVSGALGTEMLQGYAFEHQYYFFNEFLVLLQEVMEMAGIALFIHALVKYIGMYARELTIGFK